MALSKRRKQRIARIVRDEQGVEMTPDEVETTMTDALANIRKGMLARGVSVPDDDDALLELVRDVKGKGLR